MSPSIPGLPELNPNVVVHEQPRITATKLAEYLVTKPHLQDQILHDSKFAIPPIVSANQQAVNAITDYCSHPHRPQSLLDAAKEALSQKATDPAISPKAKDEAERCIDIIEQFELFENKLGVSALPLEAMPEVATLDIKGVAVSIQPHWLVDRLGPRGGRKMGVGFVRVAKTPDPNDCKQEVTKLGREQHRRELAFYLLALGELLCTANPELVPKYDRATSFVADIRMGERLHAPPDLHLRIKSVEAACDHIFRLWETVHPKPAICA